MRHGWMIVAALSVSAWLVPDQAAACGGFFCSRTPVDQNAERVVFTVHEDGTTDMVVQITYAGQDEDFAWVLPVAAVPENRETFPQMALNSLDTGTAPRFQLHPECQSWVQFEASADSDGPPNAAGGGTDDDSGVTVFVREEVGPYDVAVIGSDDANASITWLKDNGYNIAETMFPYIHLYTEAGMKFLALRLTADSDASDIQPFKMTLPGESPGIPLRLTALAAEPEMGVLVWVFADQRFGPANADEVEIDSQELRWDPWSFGSRNNWTALVAREVDRYAGRAWVAEVAGDTEELRAQIESAPANTEELEQARDALLALLGNSSYMTRMYTRLSPEEMTYDPTFKRTDGADVEQVRQLPFVEELCTPDQPPPPLPCDYAACGALGFCVNVKSTDAAAETADAVGCACAPGATARTTFGPDGSVTVSCQEQQMSFMNPGDRPEGGQPFPDNCTGFECGEHGTCVNMNLTPTCECEEGYVALGSLAEDGSRRTRCILSPETIPKTFYNRRPLERPAELPVGRAVELEQPQGVPDVVVVDYGAPGEGGTPGASAEAKGGGGCSSLGAGRTLPTGYLMAFGLCAALAYRRSRRTGA